MVTATAAPTYREQIEGIWRILYGPVSREVDPGLVLDRSRRRTIVLERCIGALPASTRLFCGLVPDGLDAYLGSARWHGREPEPGSVFPATGPVVRSFADHLRSTWMPYADPWVRDIAGYEIALIWGEAPPPPPRAVEAGEWLAPGAWVSPCGFDVPDYVTRLSEACGRYPWPDAAHSTRPRARPFATVTVPTGGRLRRVHLRDRSAAELRWLWDDGAEVTDGPVRAAARQKGLLVRHG